MQPASAAVLNLVARLLAGDRRALSQAITRVESRGPERQSGALALLRELAPHAQRSLRVGVSGPPGVGKSTLLEALGLGAIERGQRPAVLCVDPSSEKSGGSILGDKTRMPQLSRQRSALVRPSPAGGHAGGIARATGEALLLCEAAGYDPTFVETVGVGQAESAVTSVVDVLLLLVEPGGGDELQGIKRGLNESGDLIVVNKADGARERLAQVTRAELESAVAVLRGGERHPPQIVCVSAAEKRGVEALWQRVVERHGELRESGELSLRQREQRVTEFRRRLAEALIERFRDEGRSSRKLLELEARVRLGEILPRDAVGRLVSDRA